MLNHSRVRLAHAVLGWGLVLSLAQVVHGDAVEELIEKLEKQREQIGSLYHATVSKAREGGSVRESLVQTWERRTSKTRKQRTVSTTKTSDKDGKRVSETDMLTVSDGEHEWRQMRVGDKVMVFKSKPSTVSPLAGVREALRMGKARFKGRERIAQQPCVVIESLAERRTDPFKATYWISESHGVVLRSVIARANRSETELTTTEFKVDEPIEDAKFTYSPPADTVVIDTDAIGKQSSKTPKP